MPPPAATPTVAPPVAAATPTPVPTPVIVTRSGTDGLLLPGILIGIALLGGGVLAAMAFGGRGSPRMRHAWSEAALPHPRHVGRLLGLAQNRPLKPQRALKYV